MTFLVYRLTNTANGKCYIGITSRSLDARWAEHKERARQGRRDSRVHVAMRKYGNDSFTREVIATAETEDEVRALEQKFIAEYNSYEAGYNCNLGGNGHLHFPEHIRRKISDAQRGKVISPDARAKMSAAKAGQSRCASNFGDHLGKGSDNPRAGWFVMSCPDGMLRVDRGLRAFIRENKLHWRHLQMRGHSKGFHLLDRFSQTVVMTANSLA